MTAPWKETPLPTILSRYKLEDIFNTDEFGLSNAVIHLSLERAKIRGASRTSSPCHVSTKHNQKGRLAQTSSQIG